MKAKEYADRYLSSEDKRTELVKIGREFIIEIRTVAEQRKARKDMAIVAIVKEQEKKWEAFCNRVDDPTIREDGFMKLFEAQCPGLFSAVQAAETFHRISERRF